RREQDQFALESHRKANEATCHGRFSDEIVPMPVSNGHDRGTGVEFLDGMLARDETIRPDTTLDKLSQLPPAFSPEGTLTAGNSSGMTDGASALVLTTRAIARNRGLAPLFSVVAHAVTAVDNAWMGEGPSVGLPRALGRAGMQLDDLDSLEVNEAFAGMV